MKIMQTKNALFSILGAAAIGWAAPQTQAAVVISTGSQPTTDVQVSQASHDVGISIGWRYDVTSGLRDVGQSFLATSAFSLEALSIFVNQTQATTNAALQNAVMTLTIFSVASSTSSGTQGNPANGTVVSTQTGTFASDFTVTGNTANSWITFSLDTPVSLAAGGSYVWMLSFENQAANRVVTMAFLNGNTYANGFAWVSTDGSTYSLLNGVNADTTFILQGTAVPEPATATLMAAAVALGLICHRRRTAARRIA
ncbi:hypothetical protein DB345_02195 [Spartobacteria bacterium LR76]|nr:hypothetical protein DB345_02195 [Spartobacteria bacterium LR76]